MQFVIALFLSLILSLSAFAQSAAILPPAVTQFFDNNGNPLAAGTVTTYIAGTSTLKTTWREATETIPNTNPIILDAGGKAIIFGEGNYRQVVKDRNGNLIWDGTTSAFGSGSASLFGDGTSVGTILSWPGIVAPSHYAFAYGQELSRTTYATLYAAITLNTNANCSNGSPTLTGIADTSQLPVGAKVENTCVPAGSAIISKTASTVTLNNNANVTINVLTRFFPWGNGNGTTTFNVPDLRGVVLGGRDNMGGTASARLTAAMCGNGGQISTAIGSLCGFDSHTLTVGELATHTHAFTGTALATHSHTIPASAAAAATAGAATVVVATGSTTTSAVSAGTPAGTNSNTGSSTAFSIVQPTATINYIIKILADISISTPLGTGIFDNLIVTEQAYLGPGITVGSDKTVTISGGFDKLTATGNQNLMLISNDTIADNPLAMSMQVIGSPTSNLRQGEIQISEYGLATYHTLALQPSGGNVSIGLPFGTASGALLDVRGTTDILKPSYTLTDASSWAYRQIGIATNLDGSIGPRYNIVLQNTINGPTGYPSYQTTGILVQGTNGDVSGGGADRDYVAIDARGSISSINTLGRAWGLITFGEIQSGGTADGLLVSHEIAIVNNGTSQTSVNTSTSKYNSNYTSGGANPVTAAINLSSGGPGWHKIIYANPASISSGAGAGFIELLGAFSVKKTGYTDIGGSGLTLPPLGIQAENALAGLAIDIRGRAADGVGCIRWLANDGSILYGQLCSDGTPELSSGTSISPSTDGSLNSGKSTNAWLGTYTRNLILNGSTSGALTQTVAAIASTPTITWGTSSGTPAVTASYPLSINSTTGNASLAAPAFLEYSTVVDFNVGNTDTVISISLPTQITRYAINNIAISGASQTLTTATIGVFTAAAGAGTAIVTGGSAITVNTASENTNNNTQALTINNGGTISYTAGTLFIRVGTAQGAAATGTVTVIIRLLS